MKPQSLLYLHPPEKWERELANDPPIEKSRAPLLGLLWTVLVLLCMACWSVGLWLFLIYRVNQ